MEILTKGANNHEFDLLVSSAHLYEIETGQQC